MFQRPNGFGKPFGLLFSAVVVGRFFRVRRIAVGETRQRVFDFFERGPERRVNFVWWHLSRFVRVVVFCFAEKERNKFAQNKSKLKFSLTAQNSEHRPNPVDLRVKQLTRYRRNFSFLLGGVANFFLNSDIIRKILISY